MSTKTIGFPSNPELDQEYQGWVWDGEKWVSTAVDGGTGGLWEENGDDIYYSDGNVGIGTDDPSEVLEVHDDLARFILKDTRTAAPGVGGVMRFQGNTSGTGSPNNFAEIKGVKADGSVGGEFVIRASDTTGILQERMRIDADGNVGIGTDDPVEKLTVESGNALLKTKYDANGVTNAYLYMQARATNTWHSGHIGLEGTALTFATGGTGVDHTNNTTRMTIDADGNVGIGMTPVTFDLSAKEQLAEWKTKAKKASWPVVTDGAFEQEPTEDLVAQWIETRAAGDKLQVAGSAAFADPSATNVLSAKGARGGAQIFMSSGAQDVNASMYAGGSGTASFCIVSNKAINLCTGTTDQSGNVNSRLNISAGGNATFTGSVTADKFFGDGSGLTGVGGGGGGLPDGDYTHNGKITATDFISTSDERLKENITPMPIGLIDDIKPVSWEWKDGSGPSAGVVAQQLQAVGLGDYVSEDEDGQLGVNYQALTAILLAEVIELKRSLK